MQIICLDLSTVVTSVSGPKRPHDRVSVSDMHNDFRACLTNKVNYSIFIHLKYYQNLSTLGIDLVDLI